MNFAECMTALARRKAEAEEKAKSNNDPRGIIYADGFHRPATTADVVKFATEGVGWRNVLDVAKEQAASAAYERRHRNDLVMPPEPIFDTEEL